MTDGASGLFINHRVTAFYIDLHKLKIKYRLKFSTNFFLNVMTPVTGNKILLFLNVASL